MGPLLRKASNHNEIVELIEEAVNYRRRNLNFRPQNIIVFDSYNNPFFPYPDIIVDKASFDLPRYRDFLEKQAGYTLSFLPFHFYVEFVDDRHYVFLTRPLTLSPILEKKYDNSVAICILGDSDTDVYDRRVYSLLGSLISEIFHIFRWGAVKKDRIEFMLGKNFHVDKIFIQRTRG